MLLRNHPTTPIFSSPAGSEVALPKAGVDFTSFVSFSSSKPSAVDGSAVEFFLRFFKKARELTMNSETYLTIAGWFNPGNPRKQGVVQFEDTLRNGGVGCDTLDYVHQLYQISISI